MSVICSKEYTVTIAPGFVNLKAYWKCEDTAAPVVDEVGTADLTPSGAIVSVAGIINKGFDIFHWNASETASAVFNFINHDFTIRAWIYLVDPSNSQFRILNNSNTDYAWILEYSPLNTQLGPSWTVYDEDSASYQLNANAALSVGWHRIIAWVDNKTEIGMKIDNNANTTMAIAKDLYTPISGDGAFLGDGSENFHDRIDEVGIWDKLWTPFEMLTDWNGGAGQTYPNVPL